MTNFTKITSVFCAISFSCAAGATDLVTQFSDVAGLENVNVLPKAAYEFDTVDFSSTKASLNGTKIEINETGLYQVTYALNWATTDNQQREIKTSVWKNGASIIGQAYGYARRQDQAGAATNAATFYVQLEAGDHIELFVERYSTITGPVETLPGESWIALEYIDEQVTTPPPPPGGSDPVVPPNQFLTVANPSSITFTAFDTYHLDVPQGVFDAHGYDTTGAIYGNGLGLTNGVKYGRALWNSKLGNSSGQWIRLDFTTPVILTRADFISRPAFPNRNVKNLHIEISTDNGVTFTTHQTWINQPYNSNIPFTFNNQTPQITNVRFLMDGNPSNNQGNIELDEIVLYGQEM